MTGLPIVECSMATAAAGPPGPPPPRPPDRDRPLSDATDPDLPPDVQECDRCGQIKSLAHFVHLKHKNKLVKRCLACREQMNECTGMISAENTYDDINKFSYELRPSNALSLQLLPRRRHPINASLAMFRLQRPNVPGLFSLVPCLLVALSLYAPTMRHLAAASSATSLSVQAME
ncbi:hypothetical protein NW759_008693 [Fusarium solani]|nr:hypothetical protein NW759_008693 [Fusarium solani]